MQRGHPQADNGDLAQHAIKAQSGVHDELTLVWELGLWSAQDTNGRQQEPAGYEWTDMHRKILYNMERQSSAEETDAEVCKLTFAHRIAAVLKSRLCFSSTFHVFSSFCKLGTALLLSASKRCTVCCTSLAI